MVKLTIPKWDWKLFPLVFFISTIVLFITVVGNIFLCLLTLAKLFLIFGMAFGAVYYFSYLSKRATIAYIEKEKKA